MHFRELDYQQRVLTALDAYLSKLAEQKARADAIAALARENPGLGMAAPDFAEQTWQAMRAPGWAGPRLPASRPAAAFSPRRDGAGRPVPNICLKVPTGGGKTYLAVSAVSRILGKHLNANTGFVLWIVPNEAIYAQTRKSLSNREHPYRQVLDRAAAGRVRILEKRHRLDARDVAGNLCVMLLMLPAANRQNRETLRLFRDRGNVHGFFPPADDYLTHRALLDQTPNLDVYGHADQMGAIVKDSLGNALRVIRPVVVLDEGQRATSQLAYDTLYGFNPCFVLELTATPKDVRRRDGSTSYANVLVEVLGADLEREGMIKMPLNITVKSDPDWRNCLCAAVEQLKALESRAERLRAETERYIRPILLVQVERTGRDQRDGLRIHAGDARDYLIQVGFTPEEIAVKTAEVNELEEPENLDLLAPTCPVRAIVTKQALQEGWDCPFAYVLCSLAASANLMAMTQLVGRILRQPHAEKTGAAELDECYVFCHHVTTRDVVAAVKRGLEEDGLADLVKNIRAIEGDANGAAPPARTLARRDSFRDLEIFLPLVLWVENGQTRRFDYEQDILLRLDWSRISTSAFARAVPEDARAAETQLRRIRVTNGAETPRIVDEDAGRIVERAMFDRVFATRIIADTVPNPWVARSLVEDLAGNLLQRGFTEDFLGSMSSFILEGFRNHLVDERDRLAEALFKDDLALGRIQFRLRTDRLNYRLPFAMACPHPERSRQLVRDDGNPIGKSLFAPVYEADFNTEEAEFACYLDESQAIEWWHRNVAKAQYGLQGWRKHKVYPDFLFALRQEEGRKKMLVIETKGDQLEGNLDTAYKEDLLQVLSAAYRFENVVKAGKLELVLKDDTSVVCDLVLLGDWRIRLPNMLAQ